MEKADLIVGGTGTGGGGEKDRNGKMVIGTH